MLARNYRRLKRVMTEDFRLYLKAPGKKPLFQQVHEIYQLHRLYDYIPYQYLKHSLYLRKYGKEIYRYLPPELLHIARDEANAGANLAVVDDKLLFERTMRAASLRTTRTLFRLQRGRICDMSGAETSFSDYVAAIDALALPDGFIVKPLSGGSGSAVFKFHIDGNSLFHKGVPLQEAAFENLIFTTNNGSYWTDFIAQETIFQHPDMARFNPTSVNTIRIDTFVDAADAVHFNAAALKVGPPGSITDNSSTGGYMIAIDLETGRLVSDAKIEAKFGGRHYDVPSVFGVDSASFVVPAWQDVLRTVRAAARALAPLRSLGWDVAVTPEGALVIEANADYGIDVLQELAGGYVGTALARSYLDSHSRHKAKVLSAAG